MGFLKIQLFHRHFSKILPKHSRTSTERSTTFQWHSPKIYGYFFVDCNDFPWQKYTKQQGCRSYQQQKIEKVTWHCCWSISNMNLNQLIFTWKGRYLVLALFASINNSLTMISRRAMWHHLYIGLAYQNCFSHAVLVLMALSMALSNFVKGTIRSNAIH